MSTSQETPLLLLDNLYCSEQHCDEHEHELEQQQQQQEVMSNAVGFDADGDLCYEDEQLVALFSKQAGKHDLFKNLKTNPVLASARCESVEWMLKVNAFYSFSTLTALLAVDYFDRFLFNFRFDDDEENNKKPWMTQLASVACLSLAAKVEETHVPLLLDFQVEETKYVFEAKTIQRMEILVLSTLQWRMNPVTPLSFIDFATRRLGFKNQLCWEFVRMCETVLVSLLTDVSFMCYLPSEMATATMLHVLSCLEPCIVTEYQNQLMDVLPTDKDKVEKCCEFILESTLRRHVNQINQRKHNRSSSSLPGSPNGVIDMSFSFNSDSSNDSWVSTTSSVSSSPEPLSKKIKINHPRDTTHRSF